MMKINLLPRGISQKAVVRNTAILFAALLLVLVAAGVAYTIKLNGDVRDMEAQAADAEAWEARVKEIQTQTQELLASIQPIQQKLDFINKVLDYNLQFPKLYEELAKWTYERVVLTGVVSDGQQVVVQARVKSLDDLGRYLLNMYRAANLFTEVVITGISGFGPSQGGAMQAAGGPPGLAPPVFGTEISGWQAGLAGMEAIAGSVQAVRAEGGFMDFTVTCKLKTPIVVPTFAAGGEGQAAPGTGAPGPGTMPGQPGPMSGEPTM